MKKFLLKSLLVAVGLLTGGSAWGQTTAFSQNFTDKSSTDPADYDFAAGTCSGIYTATVSGGIFTTTVGTTGTGANQNNYTEHVATFSSIGSGNVVTFTCNWSPGGATGNGKSILALQDASGNEVMTLQKGNGGGSGQYHVYINGTDVMTLGSGNNGDTYAVSATINMSTQKITALTIGSIYTLSDAISFTATSVSKIYFYQKNKANWSNTATLDNVVVSYEAAATTATVTYKYEDTTGTDLSSLKADVEQSEEVDATISDLITSALTASFYNGDNSIRYDYSTFTCSDATVPAGGTTVTLKFTPKAKYTYTVRALDSSSNVLNDNIASGFVYAGDNVTVAYPRWILNGTTLYSSGSGAVTYSTTFTPDADNYVMNITYNSGTVSNVAFYTEGEDVDGASIGSNDARASKGQMGYTASATTYVDATTLAPGKYQIYMRSQNGNNAARDYNFKVGGSVVFTGSFANGTNTDANSEEFTVYETSTLSFASVGSSASGIDYFYVVKTGDATVSKTITSAEWATLYTPYALDFSEVAGLKAYTASVSDNTVYLTPVNDVPANTGVVLNGDADTYTIPVIASSATGKGELTGNTSATTAFDAFDGYTLYVLKPINGGQTVQFNTVTSGSIAAGKAFLKIATGGSPAPSLKIAFTDAETGIDEVNAPEAAANGCFNLAGQRIANPTKGLYIVNGKKVLVK